MQLISTSIHGLGPFGGTVALDAATLPGLLTAVVGPNGAGKSTLLGCAILGAIFRKIPKLGGGESKLLKTLARGHGAYVESVLDIGGGTRIRVKQIVDKDGTRSETLVTDPAGRPLPELQGTSVAAWDAWAARRLAPYDVACTSAFLPQQSSGVLRMTAGERKRIVLRANGAEHYGDLAAAARTHATETAEQLAKVVGRVEAERDGAGDLGALEAELREATAAVTQAVAATQAAVGALATAEARAAADVRVAEALERLDAIVTNHSRALEAMAGADATQRAADHAAVLDDRIANLEASAVQARQEAEEEGRARSRALADRQAAEQRIATVRDRLHGQRFDLTETELPAAEVRHADLEARLGNNRKILADATEIRAAATRLVEIDAGIARAATDLARLTAEREAHERAWKAAQRAVAAADERVEEFERRVGSLRERVGGRRIADEAARCLPAAQVQADAATTALREADAALRDAESASVVHWQARHRPLRAFVEEIAGAAKIATPVRTAGRLVAEDDAAAALPPGAAVAAARAFREQAVVDAGGAATALSLLRADAAKVAHFDALAVELAEQEAAVRAAQGAVVQREAESDRAKSAYMAIWREQERVAQEQHDLTAARAIVAEKAKHAARLNTAEERIADLERGLGEARAAIDKIGAEIDAIPALIEAETKIDAAVIEAAELEIEAATARQARHVAAAGVAAEDLVAARRARVTLGDVAARQRDLERAGAEEELLKAQRAEAERTHADALRAAEAYPAAPAVATACAAREAAAQDEAAAAKRLTRAEAAVARAAAGATRLATLATQRAVMEQELADWRTLADDLGINGLQADIADAAAPELTAITNDLLQSCLGSRWTVEFRTVRKDSKKRDVEGFSIVVTDNETGRQDDASDYCGGETALIGAAVADAIAVLACRRAGIDSPTVVRDEAAAALDPVNERAWVAMMRRMATLTGASKVYVVTHSASVRALCDSVVEVRDGHVRVLTDADMVGTA